MTKKIVFEIYHEVKNIIEQAYLEEEMTIGAFHLDVFARANEVAIAAIGI